MNQANKKPDGTYQLDITGDICPLTFVKTKLFIEKLEAGDLLEVRLKGGEPLENVPRSLEDHGHEVLSLVPEDTLDADDTAPHLLLIKKN